MIIVDNNISPRIVSLLRGTFKGILHVNEVELDQKDDSKIWEYATSKGFHILTKDKDFNAIQQIKGFPPKIIWLRMGNASTKTIFEVLQKHEKKITSFLLDPTVGKLDIL